MRKIDIAEAELKCILIAVDYRNGWNDAVDAMHRWISVEERLPESEKPVLAVVQTNDSPVFKSIAVLAHINAHEVNTEDNFDWREYEGDTEYDEENDCFWIPECWYEVNIVDDNPNWMIDRWERVTHWMPLPEPPEEGDDEG